MSNGDDTGVQPAQQQQPQPGSFAWNVSNPWSFPRGWWPAQSGQTPYMTTRAPRAPSDWGKDDFILAGGKNYQGGQPPWPMPQPNEIPGIMHGLTMDVGRHGPPGVAMPMIAAGRAYGRYAQMAGMASGMGGMGGVGNAKAFAEGLEWRQRYEHNQFMQQMAVAAARQQKLAEGYGLALAEYGPHTDPETGKWVPGEPDKLKQEFENIANGAEGGTDRDMLNLIHNDFPAAIRRAQWYDHTSQDQLKILQAEEARMRLREGAEKEKAAADKSHVDKLFGTGPGSEGDTTPPPSESPATGAKPGKPEEPAQPQVLPLPKEPVEDANAAKTEDSVAEPAITDQVPPPSQEANLGDQPLRGQPEQGIHVLGPARPGMKPSPSGTAADPSINEMYSLLYGAKPPPGPRGPVAPSSPQPPASAAPPQQTRTQPQPPPPPNIKPPPQRADKVQWRTVPDPEVVRPMPHVDAVPHADTLPGTPNMDQITKEYGWTQRQIDDFARQWIMTGQTGFVGADPYDRGMSNIIKKRGTQFLDYVRDITNALQADNPKQKKLRDAEVQKILDRIAEVNPDMADRAGPIIKGNAPLATTGYAASSKFWIAEGNLIHSIVKNFNNSIYDVNRQTRLSFANGHSYPYLVRLATDRMLQHTAIAIEAAKALGNGTVPPANWIKQWVQEHWFGDPRPLDLRVIAQHLGEEGNRVFRGNAGAEADIRREIANIQNSNSPAQQMMYLKAISDLLYEQQSALANVWNEGTGESKTAEDMMFASGRAAYDRIQALTKDVPYYQPQWHHDNFDNIQLESPDGKWVDPLTGQEMTPAPLPQPGQAGFYPPGYDVGGGYPIPESVGQGGQ